MNVIARTGLETDAQLVERSLSGDRGAFGQIVERYQSLICALTFSATGDVSRSEDLGQETFLAAWRDLGNLKDPERLKQWLCGIARHMIQECHRRAVRDPLRHAVLLNDVAAEDASRAPDGGEHVFGKEEQAILWQVLEGLPESYREVLVLFYRQEQSVAEVAEALGVSNDVVRQRLSRGRAMLRDQVASLVEKGLRSTAPTRAFALGVVAALEALRATGEAAAAGAATAVAKVSGGVKGAGLLGAIGPAAAALGAAAGGIVAIWGRIQSAGTTRERRFLIKTSWGFGIWVAVCLMVLYLVGRFNNDVIQIRNLQDATGWTLLWIALFGPWVAFAIWMTRRQRQIRIEEGHPQPDRSHRFAVPEQKGFRTRVYGGLAALVFGATCWLMVIAASAGDWLVLCLLPLIAAGVWLVGAGVVVRHPKTAGTLFQCVYWAMALLIFGIVNLRVHQWCRNGPPQATLQVRLILNFFILGFYGSIGLAVWLERHFAGSRKPRRDAAVAVVLYVAAVLAGLALWRS